jgi:hypothetical protein
MLGTLALVKIRFKKLRVKFHCCRKTSIGILLGIYNAIKCVRLFGILILFTVLIRLSSLGTLLM